MKSTHGLLINFKVQFIQQIESFLIRTLFLQAFLQLSSFIYDMLKYSKLFKFAHTLYQEVWNFAQTSELNENTKNHGQLLTRTSRSPMTGYLEVICQESGLNYFLMNLKLLRMFFDVHFDPENQVADDGKTWKSPSRNQFKFT